MNTFSRMRLLVLGMVVAAMSGQVFADGGVEKIRRAEYAGNWYSGDAEALAKELDELLAKPSELEISGKPLAIISPHAGYRFSASVAAPAYQCLKGHSYKRVIMLGFSHQFSYAYEGVDAPTDLTAYETPLGLMPIDVEACKALLKSPAFLSQPRIDRGEKSIEMQLPFLQRMLGDFTIVPLHVGRMTPRSDAQAAEAILRLVDEDTLIVASSDFTHYGSSYRYVPFKENVPEKIREYADRAAASIELADYDGFAKYLSDTRDTICGRGPVTLLLRILSMRNGGADGVRAAYDTSGRQLNDWNRSVTYQSFVFVPRRGTLSDQERSELLEIARRTITAHLSGKAPPKVDSGKLLPGVARDGACFVTLENRGELRGCIGNMTADGPLFEAVIRNAVNACQDYRFVNNPVKTRELGDIHIEISYLTPMKEIKSTDEIVIGRHGLWILLNGRRGVFLPQVAAKRGWTREEFLGQLCRKASLPLDAWKQPEARISSFEAEVFGE